MPDGRTVMATVPASESTRTRSTSSSTKDGSGAVEGLLVDDCLELPLENQLSRLHRWPHWRNWTGSILSMPAGSSGPRPWTVIPLSA